MHLSTGAKQTGTDHCREPYQHIMWSCVNVLHTFCLPMHN